MDMKFEIILEDNGQVGAVMNIDHEHIFTVGKDFDELLKNLKEAVACAFTDKKKQTAKYIQVAKFLHLNDKVYAA
jgi:predicted RNase H-like HicB family nuclease